VLGTVSEEQRKKDSPSLELQWATFRGFLLSKVTFANVLLAFQ